jgi:hypothetical protein
MAFWDGAGWRPLEASTIAPQRPHRAANWIATLVIIVGLVGVAIGGPARGTTPALTFDPALAPGGVKVTATGSGLPPSAAVQFEWDGSKAGMPKARVSNRGTLSARFTVPAATPGEHTVTVRTIGKTRQTHGAVAAGLVIAAGVFAVSEPAPDSPAETASPSSTTVASASPSVVPSGTPTSSPRPADPTPAPTASPSSPQAGATWLNVIDDEFDGGSIPAHWVLYDGPYGSGTHNCATPSHVSVSGGSMHMLMRYENSGKCGAGWYTAGMRAKLGSSVDQRTTVRFRVVSNGVVAHRIIPMRWPTSGVWPAEGEEDFCEGHSLTDCWTFLHYGATNNQIYNNYAIDLMEWHTFRFVRLNHVVKAYIDDMSKPVWSYTGTSITLPDTLKHVVLQQECKVTGCPSGTQGTEDIQIDSIAIDVPAN